MSETKLAENLSKTKLNLIKLKLYSLEYRNTTKSSFLNKKCEKAKENS